MFDRKLDCWGWRRLSLILGLCVMAEPGKAVFAQPDPARSHSSREEFISPIEVKSTETLLTQALSSSPAQVSLRTLALKRGIQIGAAVAIQPLQQDLRYAEILAREFNLLTPENAMKWDQLHPEETRYDFKAVDTLVEYAAEHKMLMRGHTLVWHRQQPAWLEHRKWTQVELITILREHIATLVGRYRGQISSWDVVNEAIDEDGSLRDSLWLRGIGPDYIEQAFRMAHEADPKALLFYNDFGGEGLGPKSDAIYTLVKDLIQKGVPIHGVGLQMHVSVDQFPEPAAVAANMRRLADLGLVVHITEMDVRIPEPATSEQLAKQAQIYRDMFEVCVNATNCQAFVTWGVTDGYSWVPQAFDGEGVALLFDNRYRPKPAYHSLLEVLTEPRSQF